MSKSKLKATQLAIVDDNNNEYIVHEFEKQGLVVKTKEQLKSAISKLSSSEGTIIVVGNIIIDEDITIPENIKLKFEKGGKLAVNSGCTLTLDCAIDAGLFRIFDGNGAIDLSKAVKSVVTVDTIKELVLKTANIDGIGCSVNVLGYHEPEDGGGGYFYWDANEDKANHNGGTIIDPNIAFPTDWNNTTQQTTWFTAGTGSGCWKRIYDGAVNVKWFGAKGDYVGGVGTDDTKSIQQAALFCYDRFSMFIDTGNYYCSDVIDFTDIPNIVGNGRESTQLFMADNKSILIGKLNMNATGFVNVSDLSVKPVNAMIPGHVGVIIGSDSTNPSATYGDKDFDGFRSVVQRINVWGFDVGIKYEGHTWSCHMDNVISAGNNIGLHIDFDGIQHAGSAMNFTSCNFYNNSDKNVFITGATLDGMFINMFNVSFENGDYGLYIDASTGGAFIVSLFGCHFEMGNIHQIYNNGSILNLYGTNAIGMSGTSTNKAIAIYNKSTINVTNGRFAEGDYCDVFYNDTGAVLNASYLTISQTNGSNFKGDLTRTTYTIHTQYRTNNLTPFNIQKTADIGTSSSFGQQVTFLSVLPKAINLVGMKLSATGVGSGETLNIDFILYSIDGTATFLNKKISTNSTVELSPYEFIIDGKEIYQVNLRAYTNLSSTSAVLTGTVIGFINK